ncbi:MAG TPA: hypothetical protein VGI39_39110 [Polyangiaceae bacterium]|jgi:hypothetical protein
MSAPLSEDEIAKVLKLAMTPRAERVSIYQRYVDGTVYEGRAGFLDQGSEKPLTERAPCVIYPGVRNAIRSFSSMALGDRRFPVMTTLTSEDDGAFDDRFGLTPEQSEVIDAYLGKICEQARLPAVSKQLLEHAMGAGTCVPMPSVVKGKLRVTQLDPKTCWPEFEEDGVTLAAVEVRYLYVDPNVWNEADKRFEKRVYQYRRRIDAQTDIVFEPIEIRAVEDVPLKLLRASQFQTKEKSRFVHGFGFCPAIWYRFLETVSDVSQIDGRPIHWGLLSLCDSVNFGLSQRFRAALYCGEPQVYETGVDDEASVEAPYGRASTAAQMGSDPTGWKMPLSGRSGAQVRKKGPGVIWTYTNAESKVNMLTIPNGGLDPLVGDIDDNRSTLRESLGHVTIDAKTLSSSDLSGKAIERLFGPQVAICNELREDFGANCLLPLVNMLLRIALASGTGLYLAGSKKALPILARFYQEVTVLQTAPASDMASIAPAARAGDAKATRRQWFDPTIKLSWGDYFEASDADEQSRVTTAESALDAGLITKKSALLKIKGVFDDIGNADQYLETLEKERLERESQEANRMVTMAKAGALAAGVTGKPPGIGPAVKKPKDKAKPPKADGKTPKTKAAA